MPCYMCLYKDGTVLEESGTTEIDRLLQIPVQWPFPYLSTESNIF